VKERRENVRKEEVRLVFVELDDALGEGVVDEEGLPCKERDEERLKRSDKGRGEKKG
jgi:hypothetical protein